MTNVKERVKELTPGVEPERTQPEFARILYGYMVDREIESPNELWRRLRGYGKHGKDPSRATVQGYFKPLKPSEKPRAPGRWFVRACAELLELSEKECYELYKAYFYSYE